MTRLLRVELRRLFSRQLVVLTMVGVLAVSLLLLWGVWASSQPMSDQELEFAEQMYQDELAYWEEHGEENIAQCLEDEAAESERLGEPADYGCDEYTGPEREWFITTAPPLEESLPVTLNAASTLLLLAALLIGGTFTAAELSTGSMSTWLSFEPRRLRVFASKALAAALGVVPATVLALAVVVTGSWLIADHVGLTGGLGGAEWTDTAWMALRIVGLTVLAALAGTALGILLRHTAAVLGVAVIALIAEQIVRGLVPRSAPWLPGVNIEGWVMHGTTYYTEQCTTDASGTMCELTDHALSFGHSAAYLLVAVALVVGLAAVVFRRRDAA